MDIFVSGFGILNFDTDLMGFRPVYEVKHNFRKKIKINFIVLRQLMKIKAKKLNITQFYNVLLKKRENLNHKKVHNVLDFCCELVDPSATDKLSHFL